MPGYTYEVSADIEYIDGTFSGMVIPSGYRVKEPDLKHAVKVAGWLAEVQKSGDFIRATGTGNRYRIVGRITYAPLY